MLIHIVRHNETIQNIVENYHVSFDDLKTNNLHITDFKHLKGGMKIKIPFLSEETKQILEGSESFISDYYPMVNTMDKNNIEGDENMIVPKENKLEVPNIDDNRIDPFVSDTITLNKESIKAHTVKSNEQPKEKKNEPKIEPKMAPKMEYIRPTYGIPIPSKRKSIYPHFDPKSKQNNS